MKFTLRKASSYSFEEDVEVNSLEDLERLYKKYEKGLIVAFDDAPEIVVYDDYLE